MQAPSEEHMDVRSLSNPTIPKVCLGKGLLFTTNGNQVVSGYINADWVGD